MRARVTMLVLAVALFAPPAVARSQERARFTSLDDALRAQGILAGRTGPQDVNWIDGGTIARPGPSVTTAAPRRSGIQARRVPSSASRCRLVASPPEPL